MLEIEETKHHDFTVRTLEEDFVLGEQIQRGMGTGATERLRLGTFEIALREFHDGLEQELKARAARNAGEIRQRR